jgi:hypothetical protein
MPEHCRTVAVVNTTSAGESLAANTSTFVAQQRLINGSLWTARKGIDGASFITDTIIHPDENIVLTSLTFDHSDPTATINLAVQVWTVGHNHHVRTTAASACAVDTNAVSACSRRYNTPNATAGFFSPWTAIASAIYNTSGHITHDVSNEDMMSTATTYIHAMHAGTTVQLITTLADNLLGGSAVDPGPSAATLAHTSDPATIVAASKSFWISYWNASSVSLPTRPALERMWFGSQYATVGAAASATVASKFKGKKLPPPGLYGPFATADFAFWNGDFTLDYNQEANFYHVYSSNHPERAATYFSPITDYMPAARVQAQQVAKTANLTCDPKALNFPCTVLSCRRERCARR